MLQLTPEMFIAQFPEFKPQPIENDNNCCCFQDNNEFTLIDIMLQRALRYISIHCSFISDGKREYAIFLLAAHFLTLQKNITDGETSGGFQTSASIDKVSVSVAPPPTSDNFSYFLSQTIYGQEFLGLIELLPSVPNLIGGSFQRVL